MQGAPACACELRRPTHLLLAQRRNLLLQPRDAAEGPAQAGALPTKPGGEKWEVGSDSSIPRVQQPHLLCDGRLVGILGCKVHLEPQLGNRGAERAHGRGALCLERRCRGYAGLEGCNAR